MEYSKLVAVTGLPGLYELVSSKSDGAIVRSLEDNSTRFASSRIHSFSHLESIEVYTTGDNVNLVEIFHAMEKAGGDLPDGKDNSVLKKYFEKAYPELDFERVYASDQKKMVKWYDALKKKGIEIKLTEPEEENEERSAESEEEAEVPKKKAASKEKEKDVSAVAKRSAEKEEVKEEETEAPKKKTAAKKKSTTDDSEEAEAPKKKTAAKKKSTADDGEESEAPKKKTAAKKK